MMTAQNKEYAVFFSEYIEQQSLEAENLLIIKNKNKVKLFVFFSKFIYTNLS